MTFTLPTLPYALDALEPYISKETLEYHFGKHHQTYVDNLGKLVIGTEFESSDLETIIRNAPAGGIFNNAAQIWNHTFYFQSLDGVVNMMRANGIEDPENYWKKESEDIYSSVRASSALASATLRAGWKDFDLDFRAAFKAKTLANFGSGWTWLVADQEGELSIINTSNAETPLTQGLTPLFVADVWEHAYYIDYRNARAKYIDRLWHVVNWRVIEARYDAAFPGKKSA